MKKLLFVSALSLFALAFAAVLPQSASAQTGKFRRSANGIKNRYIVVLNEKFVDRHASEPAVGSEAAY